jgi:uncharacterized membrane protein YphA (DoxX/SURF4 family)
MWNDRVPLILLLPLRLCSGYLALAAGLGKVGAGWLTQPLLAERVEPMLKTARPARALLPLFHVLLTHPLLASRLVALVELIGGAALLVGLGSRYAALCLCALSLVFLLGSGVPLDGNGPLLQSAALLTLSMCSSGRVLGADALLRPHLPGWLT